MKTALRILVLMTLMALAIALAPSTAAAAVTFSVSSFDVDTWPWGVAVGDVNGDGKRDVLICDAGSGMVNVLLGNGGGGFAPKTTFATPTEPHALEVGDFNNDGKQDVAVVNYGGTLSIFLGTGTGSFGDGAHFAAGHGFRMTAADFTNDGNLDVVAADGGGLSILLGDGAGGFGPASQIPNMDQGTHGVAADDFNEDGKTDLATASPYTYGAGVFLGDGLGAFGPRVDYPTGGGATGIAIGDLDRDGHQDLSVINYDSCTVSIRLGDGSGGFTDAGHYAVGATYPYLEAHPDSVVMGDFNGDRKLDVATANHQTSNGTVTVLLGNGKGSLGTRSFFRVGSTPVALHAADFNRDGKLDLVTANCGLGHAVVMRNASKPRLYALSPPAGRRGTTVTLTGWGFGRTRATSKVYFGTTAVTRYVYWSVAKVKVRVPAISAGRKEITVRTRDGRTNAKHFTVR